LLSKLDSKGGQNTDILVTPSQGVSLTGACQTSSRWILTTLTPTPRHQILHAHSTRQELSNEPLCEANGVVLRENDVGIRRRSSVFDVVVRTLPV